MDTINYITSDCWWDTDKTILPCLSKNYKMNVFSFDEYGVNLKYTIKENYGFNSFLVYKQKYSIYNLLAIYEACVYLYKIWKKTRLKDSLNIVIPPMWNPYVLFLYTFFLPRRRTVFSFHNYVEHSDNRDSLFCRQKKVVFKRFFFFHFYSVSQMTAFSKDYPDKRAFFTQMPLKDFGHLNLKRFSNKTTFLFFGNIRRYKRLDLFIQAANDIDGLFVIAGECPEKLWQEYEPLIENRSKFVLDIGFVDENKIPLYFENVDFLVLPYEDATQSGPSLIAINYGLPIIASDLYAFKNIVHDSQNGFLFKAGMMKSLRDMMKKATNMTEIELLEMKSNQKLFKQKYMQSCSPVSVVEDIISVISH